MSARTRRRRAIALAALAAALAVVAAFAVALWQPFHGGGHGQVVLTVPRGATLTDVARLLEARGVVADATLFSLRVRLAGAASAIEAGTYELRRDMSYGAAIAALRAGADTSVLRVVIPEGLSRREVARLLARRVRGDYLAASRSAPGFDPRTYGAPAGATLEGFLFPATYDLQPGATAAQLVRRQLEAFRRAFASVDLTYARSKNLTPYDVLIIASMVEREARVARERPLIASVIYNRLRARMPLGIDATLRYALDNWTRPLRVSELNSPTPYNTRLRSGLPPGPIGNPGLASIRAAARPARTDFLYYVVEPGTCGEHAFSTNARDFERDVARYRAARERAGGRSPTRC